GPAARVSRLRKGIGASGVLSGVQPRGPRHPRPRRSRLVRAGAVGPDVGRRHLAVRGRSTVHFAARAADDRGHSMNAAWCAGRTFSRFALARLAVTSVMVAAPAAAFAQESLQIPLQFDFLNPGAKSLALAGSFVALADDATATFANPAGLVQ